MNKLTQAQAQERELIAFGRNYNRENYRFGGIADFDSMSLSAAEALIEKGYLDPDGTQNESPTAAEFMEFARSHPDMEWVFNGYVVSPERDDCRVTLTGIASRDFPGMDGACNLADFVQAFRYADDLSVGVFDPLYAWYD